MGTRDYQGIPSQKGRNEPTRFALSIFTLRPPSTHHPLSTPLSASPSSPSSPFSQIFIYSPFFIVFNLFLITQIMRMPQPSSSPVNLPCPRCSLGLHDEAPQLPDLLMHTFNSKSKNLWHCFSSKSTIADTRKSRNSDQQVVSSRTLDQSHAERSYGLALFPLSVQDEYQIRMMRTREDFSTEMVKQNCVGRKIFSRQPVTRIYRT